MNFDKYKPLFDGFRLRGRELYAVGGCVRDALLGLEPKDFDFCTNAHPDEIKLVMHSLGANVIDKLGGNYGTVHTIYQGEDIEITTYRVDKDYPAGDRRPVVEFSDKLRDDLVRRDFTINAIAARITVDGGLAIEATEPVCVRGWQDLKKSYLTSPQDPRKLMSDDPLRIMRMYRFAAKYNLTIDPDLRAAVRSYAAHLKFISRERIQDELKKISGGPQPHNAFRWMMEDGVMTHLFPELRKQVGFDQQNTHHHLPLWEHTLAVVEGVYERGGSWQTVLAALLHDVCKTVTLQDRFICECGQKERIDVRDHDCLVEDYVYLWCVKCDERKAFKSGGRSFIGHDEVGAEWARAYLERLKFPNKDVDLIELMVAEHIKYSRDSFDNKAARKFANTMGENWEEMVKLLIADREAHHPDYRDSSAFLDLASRVRGLDIKKLVEAKPPIDGKQVMILSGLKPGPELGKIMKELKLRTIEGSVTTVEEATEWVKSFVNTVT